MKQIKSRSALHPKVYHSLEKTEMSEFHRKQMIQSLQEVNSEANICQFSEDSGQLQYEEGISSSSCIQTSNNSNLTLENFEDLKAPYEIASSSTCWLSSVWLWLSSLCVLATCCYISFIGVMNNSNTVKSCDFLNATKNMLSVEDYLALRIGIDRTLFDKPTRPSVFTFLQNDFPDAVSSVNYIGQITHNCSGLNSQIIYLDTKFFVSGNITHDYGTVIDLVKSKLEGGGILIVPHLEKVPVHVVRAFHTICDIYTPLVDKLVVFFTLTPQNLNGSANMSRCLQNKSTQLAESTLRSLWSELFEYELQPLISRLTEQVLWLRQNSY